jgi:hypothetical protein
MSPWAGEPAMSPTAAATAAYMDLVARATADSNVLGLVLAGSRGFDAYVTDRSDFDVYVVVEREPEAWKTRRGSPVETWPMTLAEFRGHALPGSRNAWNQPTFLGAKVVLDQLGGEVQTIIRRKQALTREEANQLAVTSFGEYVNSLYRSLKNLEAGRTLEGRLDALESLSPLLTTVFAIEGRVRPFNKWLRHEVAARPLAIAGVVELAADIAADPTETQQRALFRLIEPAARAAGLGSVIDGWEPDVAWLRGA